MMTYSKTLKYQYTMSETTNNLPILRQENVQMIVQAAPDAYNTNTLSANRCADYGKGLLAEIQQHGMSDELDERCANYIEKAKRTIKAMNGRRAPLTKLFDQIRSEFTSMENIVDPAKKDTVPYQIQQARNVYAAKKREEAERVRLEELRRQQREQAVSRYKQEAEDDYRRQFDNLITTKLDELSALNRSLTLDNFDEVGKKIKEFGSTLGNDWFLSVQSHAHKPCDVSEDEAAQMRKDILNRLSKQFKEQFACEVGEYRDTITDALLSKKSELERISQADTQEQGRMKAELEACEATALNSLGEQRKLKEEEAKAAMQVRQAANEINGLFGQISVAVSAGYQPKTAVKKRIVADTPDGILAVVSMWWSKEGQFMQMDELKKIFKKQIIFCEKLANDKKNPELISSPFVRYEEEVKAK